MDSASILELLSRNSEYGFGVLIFGCIRKICNVLGLFLMLGLGFKVLRNRYSCHCKGFISILCDDSRGKPVDDRNKICCDSKILFLNGNTSLRFLKRPDTQSLDGSLGSNESREMSTIEGDDEHIEGEDIEDHEFDVIALRKMIKIERERANWACLDLEKERMAAATAAEEAMAMILRLQNEKSSTEMEAHQFRRMAEQKRVYDRGVIRSLRGVVMEQESERRLLIDQLSCCRQRLRHCLNWEEGDEVEEEEVDPSLSRVNFSAGDELDGVLVSSLDMDSSLW